MSSESTLSGGVSATRSAWLLTKLRLARILNRTASIYGRSLLARKSQQPTAERPATPSKTRNRWVTAGFVAVAMVFGVGNLVRQGIINLHSQLDATLIRVRLADGGIGVAWHLSGLHRGAFTFALSQGLAMELGLIFAAATLLSAGGRELTKPDWDLEWLATLPVGRRVLLWSRVAERSIANPTGVMTLWPACTVIGWYSGYGLSAPLAGAAVALPLLLLMGLLQTLIDTGLRLKLPPPQLRNLQALLSVAAIVILYTAMSAGMISPFRLVFVLARDFPAWGAWLPTGLAVRALNAHGPGEGIALGMLLLAQAGLAATVGVWILERQIRRGVVAAGSRETGRGTVSRTALRVDAPDSPQPKSWRHWLPLSAVQRRELRLLSRDRNFLVQSTVLPVLIVFGQLALSSRGGLFSSIIRHETALAAVAFGVAAYMLMLSAFQTLNSEGGALWLLYTVPRSLEGVIDEKARLWSAIALIYPVVIFAVASGMTHHVDLQLLGLAGMVVLGVPIYSRIAVSLGVFGCNPLAQDAQSRVRATYTYLYFLLSGLYTFAIAASFWWQRIVLIVLTGQLALALFQKARDQLPFLLDPAASPPARVSAADGLIAAMLFFVIQAIGALIAGGARHPLSVVEVVVIYSIAGALTYGVFRLTYWRSGTLNVPALLGHGSNVRAIVGWGGAAGLAAGVAGLAYLITITHFGVAPESRGATAQSLAQRIEFLTLAVVAAPLFEEFIFRGLIFGGLRRSWSPVVAALASAGVFAIVHPPLSMVPVFALGFCAALAYERTGALLAPMLAHALYNGLIVGYQLFRR
jgi:hypothetical protein